MLDSRFCVLRNIFELRKKGVFATALVKKHHCWPKYVKGEAIREYFSTKDVDTTDAMRGELDSVKLSYTI